MESFKKLTALLVAFAMAFSVAACGNRASKTPPAEKPQVQQGATGTPANAVLKILSPKTENAGQFDKLVKAYTAETGVEAEARSIGTGQNSMEALRTEMNAENPPTIFFVQGLKELTQWKEGGFVLDFNSTTDPKFKALADSVGESLRLTDDGSANYGIPYNVEGYGYIVDTQMLSDLFGENDLKDILVDLQQASYAEWQTFVLALHTYIKTPTGMEVLLNKRPYVFNREKTGLAKDLTGVFAVMGAESRTYGEHFVNVALGAAFATPAEANAADDATMDYLHGLFVKYAQALDFNTSHMAGANGAAKRGADFISPADFGYEQTVQIFAQSKAVFLEQDNLTFESIEQANSEMAQRLVFMPVKMPVQATNMETGMTVDKYNASIPVFATDYYAVNAKASPEEQKLAMDFLVWLYDSETGRQFMTEDLAAIPYNADPATTLSPNALNNSIAGYMKTGNILGVPYLGAPPLWSGETLGPELLESYMTKEVWTEQDYENIADFAVNAWKELKNR